MVILIYGSGRVWVFSKIFFSRLGYSASIERILNRVVEKRAVWRVIRGLMSSLSSLKELSSTELLNVRTGFSLKTC